MESKVTDRFIKIHVVSSAPGNDVREMYQRVDGIMGFSAAAPEYAKIGGASTVDVPGDRFLVVTESVDDIYNALSKIDLLP